MELMEAEEVEIIISADGKKLWVNAPLCVLRIANIGKITIRDDRQEDD